MMMCIQTAMQMDDLLLGSDYFFMTSIMMEFKFI